MNDHLFLEIIPPTSDNIVLTNYVYHNDKVAADGTRDELRLYLNSENDPGRDFYQPDDIIVMIRVFLEKEEDDTTNELSAPEFAYKILHYSKNSRDYAKLNSILENNDRVHKSHAVVPMSELTFLDGLRRIKLGKKIIPQEVIDESLAEPVRHEFVEEAPAARIMRSRSFRDLVLYFYDFKCAVTEKQFLIDYKDFMNLEAAHLLARAAGGGSNPSNGIALERNLHWAFDRGFFTITDDYEIKVHHDAMRIEYLKPKDGMKIHIPADPRSQPNLDSLKWHRDNVYGLFLKNQPY